jgi:hypothetical protein
MLGLYNRGFLFERNAFLTVYKNAEPALWERLMPAALWTLTHRTQTLLVQNNPGAGTFTLDPYAGLIANTACQKADGPAVLGDEPPPGPHTLAEKWRAYGPVGFFLRAARKALRSLIPSWRPSWLGRRLRPPQITDERTIAQLRSVTWLLSHLDAAAAERQRLQKRRVRSDREIFTKFPLYIVPTYPGDERLFASEAFRQWLPEDLSFEEHPLDEVMEMGDE